MISDDFLFLSIQFACVKLNWNLITSMSLSFVVKVDILEDCYCSTETCWYARKSLKRQLSSIYYLQWNYWHVRGSAGRIRNWHFTEMYLEIFLPYVVRNLPNYERNFKLSIFDSSTRNCCDDENVKPGECRANWISNLGRWIHVSSQFTILFWRWKLHNSADVDINMQKRNTEPL